MARTNVTLRRRQLANRLKELRLGTGMTIEEVAERLLCSPTKISRMETAQRGASQRDVRDLCGIYGVTDHNLVTQLMTWAKEARQPGLRGELGDLGDDNIYTFMGLESAASSITELQITYVPGLFQTEQYARTLIRALLPRIDPTVLDRRVEARMTRQQLLSWEKPPRYWTFIDEAVLHRVVENPSVMEDQLDHILTLTAAPHVIVQVIPFSAGPYMSADGPFVVFEIDDQNLSDVVYVESLRGTEYLQKPNEIQLYQEAVDRIRAVALSPNESIRRIAQAKSDFSRL